MDVFVACYLIGVMVILFVLSIVAYKKKEARGELEEDDK